MKSRHSLLNRLMSRFTYSEKFIFISLMFSLSFIILGSLMIYEQENDIGLVNAELRGHEYIIPLRKLLEHVPKHKFLNDQYLKGNSALKSEVIALQSQINDDIARLKSVNDENGETLIDHNRIQLLTEEANNITPQEIVRNWDNIRSQAFDLTYAANEEFHSELLTKIKGLISHIGDSSGLVVDSEVSSHYLLENTLNRIPDLQILIVQLISFSDEVIEKKTLSHEDQTKLINLLSLISANVERIKKSTIKAYNYTPKNSQVDIRENLNPYLTNLLSATQEMINLVNEKILKSQEISLSLSDLILAGEKAMDASFKLWDATLIQTNQLLEIRKHNLKVKEFIGLFVSSLFGIIGFSVGLFIMRQISIPLNNLTEATRRLAGGDLSTRVDISYQDEIGKVGIAFNNMAQSFQTIIGQLRELLEAIKRLANGDFSARVTVSNPNDEVGQVAFSFNNMAQNFEEIISQLHQLGINLTTSATEIAAASKQQETIIMEQEATTREISVTANEISTTAKEFAGTVSEISKVAERTSELASGGKISLNHMESIMRQMVDASGNIAAKLAVLNEKAGNITSVITTITKVADQTNLLSLNASIEAEKAGEYGRSFAVIAREIRRLADQTAYATLDIEKIVNEIMSAVSSSVMGVDDFSQEIQAGVNQAGTVGEQLTKIIEQVQALTERFETVNQGMQTQSAGAEQINEAISQLSQTAQQTTESIHQFRNTIQQLNSAATDLRIAVSKIKK